MSHGAEDIKKTVRSYIMVFVALMVLTVITVAISYLHLPSTFQRVGLALLVAGVKGSLVALIFMHLKAERTFIYFTLALTAFFVVLAFGLPLWAEGDHIIGTRTDKWDAGVPAPSIPGHGGAEHGGADHGAEGGH